MTKREPQEDDALVAIDSRIGEAADLSLLEDADIAFDPTRMHLDLSKAEKRRTTALMMAIQAYQHLIIKDAEYLRVASDLARRDEGPTIKPATMDAMVDAAVKFDAFISGEMTQKSDTPTRGGSQTEDSAAQSDPPG